MKEKADEPDVEMATEIIKVCHMIFSKVSCDSHMI